MATRNIVPRVNEEGNIGTSLKNWLKGWFKNLFVSNNITDGTNDVIVADLKDATDKKHLPTQLGTKHVDETEVGDNKVIYYDLASDKLKYIALPGGGDMLKSIYDSDDDGVVDLAEGIDDGAYSATAEDIADVISKEHEHSNKTQLDLVTDGDHDVRTDNPHNVTAEQIGSISATEIQSDYAESEGESSTSATSYQDKVSLAFTPDVSGDYILEWYCEIVGDTTTAISYMRIFDGTNTLAECNSSGELVYTNDNWYCLSGLKKVTVSALTTFKLQWRINTGSRTTYIKRARLLIRRVI